MQLKVFYENSRACVRMDGRKGNFFEVKIGLRQGCVMSPWLFNVYMDSVVREAKLDNGEEGLKMLSTDEGELWRVNLLLYADNTVLMGELEESLQRIVSAFN